MDAATPPQTVLWSSPQVDGQRKRYVAQKRRSMVLRLTAMQALARRTNLSVLRRRNIPVRPPSTRHMDLEGRSAPPWAECRVRGSARRRIHRAQRWNHHIPFQVGSLGRRAGAVRCHSLVDDSLWSPARLGQHR